MEWLHQGERGQSSCRQRDEPPVIGHTHGTQKQVGPHGTVVHQATLLSPSENQQYSTKVPSPQQQSHLIFWASGQAQHLYTTHTVPWANFSELHQRPLLVQKCHRYSHLLQCNIIGCSTGNQSETPRDDYNCGLQFVTVSAICGLLFEILSAICGLQFNTYLPFVDYKQLNLHLP